MTIKELSEQRAKLVADARKIFDGAETEKRSMTAEETEQFDKGMTDADGLKAKIEELQKSDERRSRLDAEDAWSKQSAGRKTAATDPASKKDEVRSGGAGDTEDEYRAAYAKFLRYGASSLNGDEVRAMQADSETIGGYLVAPQVMRNDLIKFVDNEVFMRTKANVLPALTTAASLGTPSLDTDPADPAWTAEIATGDEDSSLALGKRELSPHPIAKLVKISNKLLRLTSGGAETLVRDRLGYKFGVTLEAAYMTGTGAQQPLGLFTASANGVTTARDVSTGNSTSAIAADNLFHVKYSVKSQYQKSGEWIFHRDAIKAIRLLKDGNGQYLWQPGLTGTPDMLLDRPVNISEYAPNTFTTGLYVGLFGDLKFYWIVDALQLEIQRLVELYAATNQVGFIGRFETDGAPVLAEAFARVKLA